MVLYVVLKLGGHSPLATQKLPFPLPRTGCVCMGDCSRNLKADHLMLSPCFFHFYSRIELVVSLGDMGIEN